VFVLVAIPVKNSFNANA